MKNLLLASLMALSLVSCSKIDFSQPLDDASDPLNSPLKNVKGNRAESTENSDSNASYFSPGSWVETAMPDAGFYKKYPRFGGKPERSLKVATPAKVISHKGSYTKVELDSGEVGYIPTSTLIEKAPESFSSSEENTSSSSRKRVPAASSDPPPPTEDEILKKIKEREEARKNQGPEVTVPTAPESDDFVAPEPEVQGIKPPEKLNSDTSAAPPTIPVVPDSIPQVAQPEENSAPATSPVVTPKPEPTPKSKEIVPPAPPSPEIKINKPVNTSGTTPINAPTGGKIDQDAALELRLTTPVVD